MGSLTPQFIFKAIFITLFLLALFQFAGIFALRIFKLPEKPFPIVEGFIFTLGVFQLFSAPLIIAHAPIWIIWLISLVCLVFLVYFSLKWEIHRIIQNQFRNIKKDVNKVAWILCIILVLYQGISSSILLFSDADDMFYIGLSVANMDTNKLFDHDPTTGNPEYPVMLQYRYQSWEIFTSVIAKVANIHPAALSRTVLPFLLIIIAYFSYFSLFKHFLNDSQIPIALIFLSIFHLFSGYSSYSQGEYLLTRIWQGKAVLLHIVFPYCINLLFLYLEKPAYKKIFLMIISFIAGIALNPIAIFILPIPLISILIIISLLQKKFSPIIWRIIVALLPLLVFAIGIKIGMSSSEIYTKPSEGEVFNYGFWLETFIGNWLMIFLGYLFIGVYIFFKGSQNSKVFLVFFPIFCLFFVWNPLVAPVIAHNITSYATYWRVFWLLPIHQGYSILFSDLFTNHKNYSYILMIAFLIMGIISNSFVYSDPSIYRFESIYKISKLDMELIQYLEKNYPSPNKIFTREDVAIHLPEITNKLFLTWSRTDYIGDFLTRKGQYDKYKRLYRLSKIFTEYNRLKPLEIEAELRIFDVDILVVPRDEDDLISALSFTSLQNIQILTNYYIYSIPQQNN